VKKNLTQLSIAAVVGIVISLSACNEDDPLPISKAEFDIVSVAPEVDVPVKFENHSLNASRYKWDFGDGTFDSINVAPTHTYDEPGSYTVSLTAYTQDKQQSQAVQDIDVGERFLTGMYIINIDMNDPEGNPWDADGSGPDVLFQLGPSDATSLDDLSFVLIDSLNVGQFKTPIGISTDDLVPANYKLSNKDYFILLEDLDVVNNEEELQYMMDVTFNPVNPDLEFITVTKRADGTGDIVIPFILMLQYQFFLTFEIR